MSYKKNIYIMLIIEFISSLFFIKVINTLYYQSKGISLSMVGIILASYQISKLIFEIPTGIVADKYSRKISTIIGLSLFEGYLILTYLGNNMMVLVVAAIFQGIGYTFISGSASAIFVDSIIKIGREDKLSFYGSIMRLAGYSGLAISALVGGILSSNFSYNFVYFVQIIFFAIPIILMLFVKEPEIVQHKEYETVSSKSVFKYIINSPILVYIIAINAFVAIAFIAIDGYYSNYLISSGINESKAGLIMFIQQIIGAITTIIFINKINNDNKLKYVKILPLFMMITLIISFELNVNIISLILYFFAQLSFIIITPLLFEIEHKNTPSMYRATVDSFFSITLSISAIVSNLIFGYFSDIYGFKSVFIVLSIISLVFLIVNNIVFFYVKKHHINSQE